MSIPRVLPCALAVVLAGLCGGSGCKPAPQPASGSVCVRIQDVLWVDSAFSRGALDFAVCYDAKYGGRAGVKGSVLPDGSRVSTVDWGDPDGFSLHLKDVRGRDEIEINGIPYPRSAGVIFHCKLESGKSVIAQFKVAPEALQGEWTGNHNRLITLIESIPELRELLQKEKKTAMIKPVTSLEEALKQVDGFQGKPEDFKLAFPDSLNDAIGMNMAIVGDKILSRGWMPDGFVQKTGFRIYRYRAQKQP